MRKRLSESSVGKSYRIISLRGDPLVKRRLMDMGLVPGVVVRVIGKAPLGDPIKLSARGFDLTLRLKEAENLVVEEE